MSASSPAIIFDLDDTLVATGSLWRRAESVVLESIGHGWSADLASQYKGMNSLDVAATIHRLLKPDLTIEACQKRLRDALFLEFGQGPILPMPGAVECVRRLSRASILAVASGSPLPLIELALEKLDLRGAFSFLISSESVARGKPFPDVFLAAARELRHMPGECIVIEDSLVGAQAARNAGMACFVVPSLQSNEIRRISTRTFSSLEEITVQEVMAARLRPEDPDD
jgi:HAD superfamily hydrolase (TIGR01509 family)